MAIDRDWFERARQFYADRQTGQYDCEAEHALDNFFPLLDALKAVQEDPAFRKHGLNLFVEEMVNNTIANAERHY